MGLLNRKLDSDDLPVLDQAILDELRQYSSGTQDLAQELIGLFLETSPEQLSALRGALQAGDRAQIQRYSHRLKGSSGAIGAQRLRKVCEDLEDAARDNGQPIPNEAEAAVCAELQALEVSLRKARPNTA